MEEILTPLPHRDMPPPHDGLSAARVAFPSDAEDFERDPRVSFSKLDSKWILEEDDGSEWEYDGSLKRWIPSVRLTTLSTRLRGIATSKPCRASFQLDLRRLL